MKMKFGALVVDGRGKIGGHVASKNRAGAYLRTKVTPVNPRSSYQSDVRSLLADLSRNWRSLTQTERDAWNNAVQAYAKTDIFGDLKNPTGFNLYQKLNNNLFTVGGVAIDSPPAPAGVDTVPLVSIAADESASSLTITLGDDVPDYSAIKVFATPGVSPGVNFVKSEYRLIQVVAPASASPIAAGAAYETRLGQITAGQKIFVQISFVNFLTGLESVPQSAYTIAVA